MLRPFFKENTIEVGVDEAGRGCLAGPVFAAAVILDPGKPIPLINDSKQLSLKARLRLENEIFKSAKCFSIGICSNVEIDEINILNASIKAMHTALEAIDNKFELVLVDGNRFKPFQNVAYQTIVKGDSLYQSIAAASILAKCARDRYMEVIHNKHYVYAWNKNKGYPTIEHRNAIRMYGTSPYHRKSFKLLPDSQLDIF